MDIGKLCSDKNDLSLNKYKIFCCENATTIFNVNIDDLNENNKKKVSKLMKKYKEFIMTPRNKIYGHNGCILLDDLSVDKIVERVSVSDLTEYSKRLPLLNDELDVMTMRWLELSEIEG
jgi:hypothetical protein